MSDRLLFIGSFPKETKGGSSTACLMLLDTPEFSEDQVIQLDSTLDDISNNLFTARIWRALKRFGKLNRILFRQKPQSALIVCGHGWSFIEKGITLLYCRLFNIPSVLYPNSGLILQNLERKPFARFTRFVFNRSKYIICQGEYWRNTFAPLVNNRSKLKVLKNWIQEDVIDKPLPPYIPKEGNTISLVYLGWLEAYKGLNELLKAVKIVADQDINVKLDIWGVGSYEDELKQQCLLLGLEQNIRFRGWASQADKQNIFQSQSILVLPSHYEGLPNVVIEGMANGLPVISSNVTTLPEIIDHMENGLLFESRDHVALASAIETLGLNNSLQEQIRINAKQSLDDFKLHEAARTLSTWVVTREGDLKNQKPKVLLLADWFPPAYRAGGPIRSCDNIVKSLGQDIDIKVVTSAYDLGSVKLDITENTWHEYYGAQVYYASGRRKLLGQMMSVLRTWKPDKIHINGVFSLKASILPLFIARLTGNSHKVVMSLRGMLMPSALHIKSIKKRAYLKVSKSMGLFKNITLHSTNQEEFESSKAYLNTPNHVIVPNLPSINPDPITKIDKKSGELSILIVGRVHGIKNIHLLPKFLQHVSGHTTTQLIGHLEDEKYLGEIELAFSHLDSHSFEYQGEVPSAQIAEKIHQNHILFLPSQSENYGHAIVESLIHYRPVVISNTTPWKKLEDFKAGYSIDLKEEQKFADALQFMVNCDQNEYDTWQQGTRKYVEEVVFDKTAIKKYLEIYQR